MSDTSKFPKKKLTRVRRESVRLPSPDGPLVAEPLLPGGGLPQVLRAPKGGADVVAWASQHGEPLRELVDTHGGILLRGFEIPGLDTFQELARELGGDLLSYTYRSTPRTEVEGRVYTSTEYPADQSIPLHNENSYGRSWPQRIFFFCEVEAEEGGRTPIADSHEVFEAIPKAVRDPFLEKGVMYIRNYGGGADLPWQEVFQTEDPAQVESFCAKMGIDYEWLGQDRLRTRQLCQAAARHPRSGKMIWFNQAHLFHISSLEQELREAMQAVFEPDELPRNTFYGDGSPIDEGTLDTIRDVYERCQVSFPWERGDVLLLDNMAVAHGRTPYRGERKIRVAMTDPVTAADIAELYPRL